MDLARWMVTGILPSELGRGQMRWVPAFAGLRGTMTRRPCRWPTASARPTRAVNAEPIAGSEPPEPPRLSRRMNVICTDAIHRVSKNRRHQLSLYDANPPPPMRSDVGMRRGGQIIRRWLKFMKFEFKPSFDRFVKSFPQHEKPRSKT